MEMLAWKEPFATISIVYISACRSFGETIQMKAKVILGIVKKKTSDFSLIIAHELDLRL
jgi:hypothetical protein